MAVGVPPRKVFIMLDTSIIYGIPSDTAVSREVEDAVATYRDHVDVTLEWSMPDVVRMERTHQLTEECLGCIVHIEKFLMLTEADVAVPTSRTAELVAAVFRRRVSDMGIVIRDVDVDGVDWKRVIEDAAFRRAPFHASGKSEKGFKDAMILECFTRLADELGPESPHMAILVCGDALLRTAVANRMAGRANVRTAQSIEDLKGVISAVVQQVDQEWVARLQDKARDRFFVDNEQRDRLYFTERIGERIRETFPGELSVSPRGATSRRNGAWLIGPPRFVGRAAPLIHWATRITVEAEAWKSVPAIQWPAGGINWGSTGIATGQGPWVSPSGLILGQGIGSISGLGALPPSGMPMRGSEFAWTEEEKVVAVGASVFEVKWQMQYTQDESVERCDVESVEIVGTTWRSS
jgi:hypothetical protein